MLLAALETEVAAYLQAHRGERDEDGHPSRQDLHRAGRARLRIPRLSAHAAGALGRPGGVAAVRGPSAQALRARPGTARRLSPTWYVHRAVVPVGPCWGGGGRGVLRTWLHPAERPQRHRVTWDARARAPSGLGDRVLPDGPHPQGDGPGAVWGRSLLQMLTEAGFREAKFHGWTGYRTSPSTQGGLITARKPLVDVEDGRAAGRR